MPNSQRYWLELTRPIVSLITTKHPLSGVKRLLVPIDLPLDMRENIPSLFSRERE
jgi:hypothetical protein